jgi:hypothetical protein
MQQSVEWELARETLVIGENRTSGVTFSFQCACGFEKSVVIVFPFKPGVTGEGGELC